MATQLPTAPDAPAWHDEVRDDLDRAWNALDVAQGKLHRRMHQYQEQVGPDAASPGGAGPDGRTRQVTAAERRLRDFLADFDKMSADLILLVIDEIFPPPAEEPEEEPEADPDSADL
jgi:hypothetical protein